MQSILKNISIVELVFFALGMIFYLRQISKMRNFWLFLPHFVRGIVGLLINKRLPKSHDVVRDVLNSDVSNEKTLGFDQIHQRVKYNIERLFWKIL